VLDLLEDALGLRDGGDGLHARRGEELVRQVEAEEAVVVDVVDQVGAQLLLVVGEVEHVELVLQVFLERIGAIRRVLHRLEFLVFSVGRHARPVGARELLPRLVQAVEPLELRLELIGRSLGSRARDRLLGALADRHRLRGRSGVGRGLLVLDLDRRVHLHLALDEALQVEGRELEDFDRLDDLRGELEAKLGALLE